MLGSVPLPPKKKPYDFGLRKRAPESKKELAAFEKFLSALPEVSIDEATSALSTDDPVIWTMRARRLKGMPYVFDVEKELHKINAEIKLCGESAGPEDYARLKAMSLRHRPFLMEPLRDQHPHKVYMKARQMGVSELCITEVLHFLGSNPATKYLYCFPREEQLRTFSNTRIKEALRETPYMKNLITDTDQVAQKTVGKGSYLILRSAWEANLGEGVDADGLVLDERDRMKPGIDEAFRESLSSSKWGYLRDVSTPTLPGVGVSAGFEKSDQRCWFVSCQRCGARQTIDYPDNVIQLKENNRDGEIEDDAYEYLCRKPNCRGRLDRLKGTWVARYPSRNAVRGYHMPQMIAPWISASTIMRKKFKARIMSTFENYVLGITSKGEHIMLTDMDFQKCTANYHPLEHKDPRNWSHISIGIDWGNTSWATVLGKNVHNLKTYVLNLYRIEDDPTSELMSVNRLIPIINAYDADSIIADAGYGRDRNMKLARLFPGRFYAAQYNTATSGSRATQPSWSHTTGKVLVDRTATLKATCKMFKERDIGILPAKNCPLVYDFWKHFKALAPITVEDDDGRMYEDIQRTGPDHFAHSTNYAALGIDRLTGTSRFDFSFVGL